MNNKPKNIYPNTHNLYNHRKINNHIVELVHNKINGHINKIND